jgi:pre-rRNA-processing protein TSR1
MLCFTLIICSKDETQQQLASITVSQSSPTSGNLTLLTNSSSFRSQYTQKGHPDHHVDQDASIQSALDLCRICDLVLFVIDGRSVVNVLDHNDGTTAGGGMSIAATSVKTSANTAHLDHVISERGDRILTAIKSQGLPTPVTLIVHGDESASGIGDFVVMDTEDDGMNDGAQDGMSLDLGCGTSLHTSRSAKSIQRTYLRRRAELKRYATRLACTEFGENHCKVMELDLGSSSDAGVIESSSNTLASANTSSTSKTQQTSISALIRTLCTISATGPTWVSDAPRPYLISDGTANSVSNVYDASGTKVDVGPSAVVYNSNVRELKLTGYIYGNAIPWNTNHLVHVPHLGTYPVKNITLAGMGNEVIPPIIAAERKSRAVKGNVEMQDAAAGVKILAEPNPEDRESLDMFAAPDALEGEQNLIGFDENDDINEDIDEDAGKAGNATSFQPGMERPAGWSDYQSAWLDAIDETEDVFDHGELAFALNKKKGDATVGGDDDAMLDEDMEVNAEDRRALLAQRKKDQKDDLEFPDEVAVEEEGAARDRYARYRALKSFRKSHWDPKENLPDTYGAVYHFASFKATQKDVMADAKDLNEIVGKHGFGSDLIGGASSSDDDDKMDSDEEYDDVIARACVPTGAYVTITLEDVAPGAYSRLSPDTILTAVSLLPHENKVSVLHAGLSQTTKCEADKEIPVKSKDVLTFRCGWKTWQGRPIFSQNNLNSDKHKFERFMPVEGAFFACTMFGPVTYSPCPVLVFREAEDGEEEGKRRELLAHGSMIGADADRIVLKRIILTGYPTRVHKRHATVKYMFYNPEDVKVSYHFVIVSALLD